jgi:Rieske Fe-S protein
VYRNKAGELKVVSAVYTHMGCNVHWNSAEKHGIAPATAAGLAQTELSLKVLPWNR